MTTRRYFFTSFVFISLYLANGCGGGSGPCGGPGQACCGWPGSSCSGSSISCQSGTCQRCGYEGGPCCGLDHSCEANLFCNSTPSTPFLCQACGHVGQPACVNNLCVTGTFSGGRCVASTGTGGGTDMCNGGVTYFIGVRSSLSHCGWQTVAVRANSMDDARACAARNAQSMGFADAEGIEENQIHSYDRTATNSTGQCSVFHASAYSEEDADRCVQYNNVGSAIARASTCARPSP